MKKILALLFAAAVLFGSVVTAFAAEPSLISEEAPPAQPPRLMDYLGLLDEKETAAVIGELDRVSELHKCDIAVLSYQFAGVEEDDEYLGKYMFQQNGLGQGRSGDGIMLVVNGANDWRVLTFGRASLAESAMKDVIPFKRGDPVVAYLEAKEFGKAFTEFAAECDGFMSRYERGGLPDEYSGIPRGVHPGDVEYRFPRLSDFAGLLENDEQKKFLLNRLGELSARYQCDIAVTTCRSFGGRTDQEYADDFFDYNRLGRNYYGSGILLVICMNPSRWYISTGGNCVYIFNTDSIYYFRSKFIDQLEARDFFGAFKAYADTCAEVLATEERGEEFTYDYSRDESYREDNPDTFGGLILIGPAAGLLIAYAICKHEANKLKSVAFGWGADSYERNVSIPYRTDTFLRKEVTRTAKPKETEKSSGSGRGGSHTSYTPTHTSSSGYSHGGGGGGF